MNLRSFALVLTVLTALALAPGFAIAAKRPVFHTYEQCVKGVGYCVARLVTNGSGRQLASFALVPQCSNKRTLSMQNYIKTKISKAGKFKYTVDAVTWPTTGSESVTGRMTITGKLVKKKKITGSWKLDKYSDACASVATGKFSMKYVRPDAD